MSNLFKELNKAKGLGSGRNGTQHFIVQRTTALLLIPLVLYFMCAVAQLVNAGSYVNTVTWFGNPFNAALSALFIAIGFYHGVIGIQVVVEDYVHCEKAKWAIMIIVKFFSLLFCAAALISIIKLAAQAY